MKRALQTFALVLATYVIAASSLAKPGSAPGTPGKYDVVFVGSYTGTGTVIIAGGKLQNFKGNIREESTGAVGTFDAAAAPASLPLDNGRFSGTGTAIGKTVTLCGRVEPADGKIVRKARIVCTFAEITSSGPTNPCRAYGTK